MPRVDGGVTSSDNHPSSVTFSSAKDKPRMPIIPWVKGFHETTAEFKELERIGCQLPYRFLDPITKASVNARLRMPLPCSFIQTVYYVVLGPLS